MNVFVKRAISLLLAIVISISLLPVSALAEDTDAVETVVEDSAVVTEEPSETAEEPAPEPEKTEAPAEEETGELPKTEQPESAQTETTESEPESLDKTDAADAQEMPVRVTFVCGQLEDLTGLAVYDADFSPVLPVKDEAGELIPGCYDLLPGEYYYDLFDVTGAMEPVLEEAFTVTAGEPMTVTVVMQAAEETEEEQTVAYVGPFVNPVYEGILSVSDLHLKEFPKLPASMLADGNIYQDLNGAAAYVRERMTQREEIITVSCVIPSSVSAEEREAYLANATHEIMDAAFAHTRVGDEGDYIKFTYTGWKCKYSYSPTQVTVTYSIGYRTTAAQEQLVKATLDGVLTNLNLGGKTEQEKVEAIHDFICDTVRYDHTNLNNKEYTLKYTAYAALINGTAVCQGYSLLFYRMALEAGLDARIVNSENMNHAWNIVKVDGIWYCIDNTWDENTKTRNFYLRGTQTWLQKHTGSTGCSELGDQYKNAEFARQYPLSETDHPCWIFQNSCGEDTGWYIDGSVLHIVGGGWTASYDKNGGPWREYADAVTEIVVEKGVTGLGAYAFYGMDKVQRVTLPKGFSLLDAYVFGECTSLTKVEFPEKMWIINSLAFYQCIGLETIELPEIDELRNHVFYGCSNLKNVTLPKNLTKIDSGLFTSCSKLESIEIPATVTEICDSAFSGCTGLRTVTFNGGAPTIASDAFSGVTATVYYDEASWTAAQRQNYGGKLTWVAKTTDPCANGHTEVTDAGKAATCTEPGLTEGKHCSVCQEVLIEQEEIPAGHKVSNGICTVCKKYGTCGSDLIWTLESGTLTISGTGTMRNYSDTSSTTRAPWDTLRGSITNVVVEEGVTAIGTNAFKECSSIRSVTLPVSVTSIGNFAFMNCPNITDVFYQGNEAQWKAIAFNAMNDGYLKNVRFGQEIPAVLSGKCGENVTWRLENGVLTISGTGAMAQFANEKEQPWYIYRDYVTTVQITGGVTAIGSYAFYNCTNVTGVTIANSVASIGGYAFYNCRDLTGITIPGSVKTIGDRAFMDCTKLTGVTMESGVSKIGHYAFATCIGLTNITIPDSVTEIGTNAFYRCSGLKNVTLSNGLSKIDYNTFFGCTGLTGIVIPNSVTEIGEYAFDGCIKLANVTIPDSVKTIGDGAFNECDSLTSVALPLSVTSIGGGAFACGNLKDVYYDGSFLQWRKIQIGSGNPALNAEKVHFAVNAGICGKDLYWTLIDGTLTISGTGAMENYSSQKPAPWDANKYSITAVVIERGATTIGSYAFYYCNYLTEITVPAGITGIGDYAFTSCKELTGITLPEGITRIGNYVFSGCSKLAQINIPASVTGIGDYAFSSCYALTAITIPSGVTSIGNSAFDGCRLKKIEIPDSVTEIGRYAFSGCSYLSEITLPAGLTTIADGLFYTCSALKNITLPTGITAIGEEAFSCSGLTGITIPAGVKNIAEAAFDCCDLQTVYFLGNLPQIDDEAFPWVTAVMKYPQGNTTYQNAGQYGGELDWQPYVICELTGHTETVDPAVTATCTTAGKTEGKHCSVCGAVLTAQETIPAKGHTEVTDAGKAATCTESGLTEGKHCSVCNTVLTAQETIPAKGHTEVTDAGKAATCTESGLTEGKHCSVCSTVTKAQEVVPAKGHTEVSDAGKAATCTESGLTEGKHCSVCNTVTKAQETVPAQGHKEVTDEAVEPTCMEPGKTEGRHCSVCNEVLTAQETIPANGHTEVTDAGKAATCTEPGLTEGSHCSVCNAVLTEQKPVSVLGHAFENGLCTRCGGSDGVTVASGTLEDGTVWSYDPASETLTLEGSGSMAGFADPESAPWYGFGDTIRTIELKGEITAIGENTFSNLTELTVLRHPAGIRPSVGAGNDSLTNVQFIACGAEITVADLMDVDVSVQKTVKLFEAGQNAGIDLEIISSDERIATVNASGEITLTGRLGSVTIIASDISGFAETKTVTFETYYMTKSQSLSAITDSIESGIQLGTTAKLKVFTENEIISPDQLTYNVISGKNCITVDADGVITANAAGTATVVAALKGDPLKRSVSISVNVVNKVSEGGFRVIQPYTQDAENVQRLSLSTEDVLDAPRTLRICPMDGGSTVFTYTSSNAAVAKVAKEKSGLCLVTVPKGANGACTITATSADKQTVLTLSVYVEDYTPKTAVTSVTLNTYQNEIAEVPIVIGAGNVITAAEFVDAGQVKASGSVPAHFTTGSNGIKVELEGRESAVETIAKVFAAEPIPNKTIKGQLHLTTRDGNGNVREYWLNLTVVSKATLPVITVTQSKTEPFNLFYRDSAVSLTVAAKTGKVMETVESVIVDESYNPVFAGASGSGVIAVHFREGSETLTPASKSIRLSVKLAGWPNPMPVTFTLTTVSTAPTYTVTPASGVFNTKQENKTGMFRLVDAKTGETLALDPGALVGAPVSLPFANVEQAGGEMAVTLKAGASGKYSGGTVTAMVWQDNWTAPVTCTFPITTTVSAKPVTTLATDTLTLNKLLPNRPAAASIAVNQSNLTVTGMKVEDKLTAAPNGVNRTAAKNWFDIRYEDGRIIAAIRDGYQDAVVAGTYTFRVAAAVAEEGFAVQPAQLNVVVMADQPVFTVQQTGSFSLFYTDSTADLTVTSVCGGQAQKITRIEVEKDASAKDYNPVFAGESDSNVIAVGFAPGNATLTPKSKAVKLKIWLEDGAAPFEKKVTLLTNADKPACQLSAVSGVINTRLEAVPAAELTLVNSRTGEKLILDPGAVTLAKSCAFAEVSRTEDGGICVALVPQTGAKSVYSGGKVELDVKQNNWAAPMRYAYTVTVSTAAPAVTLKAAGKLDTLDRANAVITYTVTKVTGLDARVTDVKLDDANQELFETSLDEAKQIITLRLKENAQVETGKTYKVFFHLTLTKGKLEYSSPVPLVMSIKPVQTALKVTAAPAAQTIYQSQSSAKVVEFRISAAAPVNAKLDSISVGSVNSLFLKSLADAASNISWVMDADGTAATVRVTIRDTSRLTAGKSYVLPLEITPQGNAANIAPVKLNLTLKVLK